MWWWPGCRCRGGAGRFGGRCGGRGGRARRSGLGSGVGGSAGSAPPDGRTTRWRRCARWWAWPPRQPPARSGRLGRAGPWWRGRPGWRHAGTGRAGHGCLLGVRRSGRWWPGPRLAGQVASAPWVPRYTAGTSWRRQRSGWRSRSTTSHETGTSTETPAWRTTCQPGGAGASAADEGAVGAVAATRAATDTSTARMAVARLTDPPQRVPCRRADATRRPVRAGLRW